MYLHGQHNFIISHEDYMYMHVLEEKLLCESKNREHFDLTLTFQLCDDQSDKRSKTARHKSNYRYSLQFFHLASDWLFPRNAITFQK